MPRRYRTTYRPPLLAFVAAVVVLGAATATAVIAAAPPHLGARLAVLIAAGCAGELVRVRIHTRREAQDITCGTAFVVAALLLDGVAAAMVAQLVVGACGDLAARRAPIKCAFNEGQKALATAASGGVLALLVGDAAAAHGFTVAILGAFALAALTHYLVNTTAVLVVMALAEGAPVLRAVRGDLLRQPPTSLLVLALAPLVAAACLDSIAVVPLFALPIWALWRSGRQAVLVDHQARHDALTDLPNRLMLERLLEEAVAGGPAALVLVDLDAFTEVNDTVGHRHGDTLLLEVAQRLGEALPAEATLARPSGDEFAVLLRGASAPEALALAEELVAGFERPFHLAGLDLELGAAIGVADAPRVAADAPALYRAAARALASAKGERGAIRLFDSPADEPAGGRLVLLTELRRALRDDEVVAYFQPQVDLADGRIRAAEALVRWQRPDGTLLAPGLFVPHAERTGLMRPLTLHVLAAALAAHRDWAAAGHEIPISVNVSARSLVDPRLVADVTAALERAGVAPHALEVELTESAMMAEPDRARAVLGELSAMGVRIAIDDFGTGYSSLAYLGRLPVNTVKIDRAFVAHLMSDPADAIIVRSTIDLGHNLGLRVVAEGVEDAATRDALRALGCDLAQGFLWSPAVPAAALPTSVRDDLNLAA
jgi:diguanylate cyclase (GGDEF)-like protein